jgi:hypothetical protein
MARALVIALLFCACGRPFTPVSLLSSVRMLQARMDLPYAKPGDKVNLEVLAVDARADQSQPMRVFWLPAPCFDPPADNYVVCLNTLMGLPTDVGTDITPNVHEGTTFSFVVPPQLIEGRPQRPADGGVPYGLAFVFSIACAGHLEIIARDPNNAIRTTRSRRRSAASTTAASSRARTATCSPSAAFTSTTRSPTRTRRSRRSPSTVRRWIRRQGSP